MSTPSPSPSPSPFDPVEAILALTNQINPELPSALSESNVSLGVPTMLTDGNANANTSIPIVAVNGEGYSKTASVYYTRIDATTYLATGGVTAPSLNGAGITSWATLFAALNAKYGTVFTEYDTPVEVFPSVPVTPLTVAIGPRSLLFVGSIIVALSGDSLALNVVISHTALTGLIPPTPPPTLDSLISQPVITSGLTLSQLQTANPRTLSDMISQAVLDGVLILKQLQQ